MIRATGWRASPKSWRGLGHPNHLRATKLPPAAYVPLPPALDQGNAGSCTGNSFAIGLKHGMDMVTGAAQAVSASVRQDYEGGVELPSRLFLYGNARMREGTFDQDAGAMLSDVADGAQRIGYCRESYWPYKDDLLSVTTRPSWSAYQHAAGQKVVKGMWRLDEDDSLIPTIKAALASGQVVVWGTRLDEAFMNLRAGQIWPGVRGREVGGHAMVIHAYDDSDVFRTRSSWTADFADGGSAQISSEAVSAGEEFFVIALAPEYAE